MYYPARWIRLKLGSFDRSLLKEVSQKLFRKIRPPAILPEPFKVLERSYLFFTCKLYNNLDSCREYSLHTVI